MLKNTCENETHAHVWLNLAQRHVIIYHVWYYFCMLQNVL